MNKCDVCGIESKNVIVGRWLFYCKNNKKCKQKELDKIYNNELVPSLDSGEMPDCEVLEPFI